MDLLKPLRLLWGRLTTQGVRSTLWWAADHIVRVVTGAPIHRVSWILPGLHVGGQYRRRGWRRMMGRGINSVVNMRIEYDDEAAGIAPERYLCLPTIDDDAPTIEHLQEGSAFIRQEIAGGGQVYVHCGSGVGRAATMAAAYLIDTGLSAEEAWARIRESRPFIRPTPVQLEQIERFAAERESATT